MAFQAGESSGKSMHMKLRPKLAALIPTLTRTVISIDAEIPEPS
jgi:hypothetical protein